MEERPPKGPSPAPWSEIARLLATHELALGAAHSMNNAFTAILGEAGYVRDQYKGDSELLESCATIHAEVSRCARMTRALLALGRRAGAREGEVDLVQAARGVASLLSDTLGRHASLELQAPDALIVVRGSARLIEPLLVLGVHHALEQAPGSQQVTVSIEPPLDGRVTVRFAARGESVSPPAVAAARAPGGLLAAALGGVVAELGATLETGPTPDGASCWRLELETI